MSATTTLPNRRATPGATPRSSPATRRRERKGILFVIPFYVLFVAMLVVPLLYAGYISLFTERLVGGVSFVGLDNYVRALHDSEFLGGVARVARFMLVQVPLILALALLFALALDSGRLALKRFVRLSIFLPYAVPSVVAALMWGYLYGGTFGPIAQVADRLGLPAPDFLSSGAMLGSIANIVIWSFAGYNMIILFSALQTIPSELYEAARIDGAGEWRIATAIKIPALRPALTMITIFSIIGAFQLFTEPYLMRNLAPHVINQSYSPNMYVNTLTFVYQDANYAAATAFLLGFVIMIVSLVFQILASRRDRRAAGLA